MRLSPNTKVFICHNGEIIYNYCEKQWVWSSKIHNFIKILGKIYKNTHQSNSRNPYARKNLKTNKYIVNSLVTPVTDNNCYQSYCKALHNYGIYEFSI